MHEIEVFLLKDRKGNPFIKVQPDLVGVHAGDDVFWHFHSLLGNEVKWVELAFAKKRARFFESRKGGYKWRRYTKLEWGHGHIHGAAPELPQGPGVRRDKYFVRGYATKPAAPHPNAAVVELDPDIIICDP